MVVAPGSLARFHVLATDASGAPVVVSAGAQWQAMQPFVGSAQGHSAEVIAPMAATSAPETAVRATFGSTQCEAKWLVLPSPAVGELLTSAVERGSGLPIAGATVVLSAPDGGTLEQQVTDAIGVARLTAVDATSTLSVFHADHSFQTIANVAGKTRTVFFALERNRADRHGGFVGSFTDVPVNSNLHLARAGLSTSAEALELTDEVEPTIATNTRVGSMGDPQTPVPIATFMSYAGQPMKPTVTAFAESGRCTDALATATGRCGVQSAWALTSDLPSGDYPLHLAQAGRSVLLRDVLWRAPHLSGFSSSVVRDLELGLQPAPVGAGGFPDLRDTAHFVQATLQFSQVRGGFHFVTRAPEIPGPVVGSAFRQAIAAGVALVPGRGLVPLGAGGASNESPTDTAFDRREPINAGHVSLQMAPPHHGLEGQQLAMVLQVFNPASTTEGRTRSTVIAPLPRACLSTPRARRRSTSAGTRFPGWCTGKIGRAHV